MISMLSKFIKNQEQMRLKIGKKLKTASFNTKLTDSKKEECTSHWHNQVGGAGYPGLLIEMLPMIKMSQKRLLFLQYL